MNGVIKSHGVILTEQFVARPKISQNSNVMRNTWLLLILLTIISGCADSGSRVNGPSDERPSAVGNYPPPETSDAAAIMAKVQPLRAISSFVDRRVRDSERKYLEWADPKLGPSQNASQPAGLLDLVNARSRIEAAIKLTESRKPEEQLLMELARKLSVSLNTNEPIIDSAAAYYKNNHYRKDGMREGIAMHSKLIKAFSELKSTCAPLLAEIDRLLMIWHKQKLRDASDQADEIELLVRTMYDKATVAATIAVKTPEAELAAKLEPAATDFENALAKLKKRIESNTNVYGRFFTVLASAQMMQLEVKERLRRFKQNPPFSMDERKQLASPSGWMVPGAPIRTERTFQDLKNVYFELTF